jgi:hypothetical protein
MGDTTSTRVELAAPAAVTTDAADWLREVGFVEIRIPLDAVSEPLAQRAPLLQAAPSKPQHPTRRALSLGALAGATVCGSASASWVAPFIQRDSSVLAGCFVTALAGAAAGGWIGARCLRAMAAVHAGRAGVRAGGAPTRSAL